MQSRFHRRSKSHTAVAEGKPCGHPRHVGTCSCCQRLQLERWSLQLAQATRQRGQH
ncbi:MAG TPA: hypothetical protein VKT31_08015 [Solirubrobacteraceae bacterium]|nr:hypothetical protein [Solirubrobacteraceae bacterium]